MFLNALISCLAETGAWFASQLVFRCQKICSGSFKDWFHRFSKGLNVLDCPRLMIISWEIQNHRNVVLHESRVYDLPMMVNRGLAFWEEFIAANMSRVTGNLQQPQMVMTISYSSSCKPTTPFIVNCDAALRGRDLQVLVLL